MRSPRSLEALLASAPELVVLVTSRERLALDGECVRMLAPLPLPRARTGPTRRCGCSSSGRPGSTQQDLADDDVGLVR